MSSAILFFVISGIVGFVILLPSIFEKKNERR